MSPNSKTINIRHGYKTLLKGHTHAGWEQDIEYSLDGPSGNISKGHLVGQGFGDPLKIKGTEETSRIFDSAANATTLTLTAKYQEPGKTSKGNSELLHHGPVERIQDGKSQFIDVVFAEDGGVGAESIDFNDAMVTIRQYE